MNKVLKMITLAFISSVILIVAVAGVAFADNPQKGNMNKKQAGDCVCNDGECVSNEYYHHFYWSGTKEPHRVQYGKITE